VRTLYTYTIQLLEVFRSEIIIKSVFNNAPTHTHTHTFYRTVHEDDATASIRSKEPHGKQSIWRRRFFSLRAPRGHRPQKWKNRLVNCARGAIDGCAGACGCDDDDLHDRHIYYTYSRKEILYIIRVIYIYICVCRVCTGERMSVYKILVAKGVEVVVTWQKTWESRKRAARVCICFLFHITNLLRLIECKIFQKRFLYA